MDSKEPQNIYLTVKDYSVSGETFELIHNKTFDFLETRPQPSEEKLSEYYKSEDYISHTDSKRNLFEKAYHLVKAIALKTKLNLINSYSQNGKFLLDVGCGTGDFLQTAQSKGWHVLGIEPNEQARKIANRKTKNAVFDPVHLSKLQKESFDIITLWHVLEHLPKLEDHIAVLKRLLKPHGTLIIAVPNYKSYDAKVYGPHWAAFDVPRHLWHFSKESIDKLMNLKKMKVIKTIPMFFDAFYVSLLSEKHKTGKMNLIRAFWVAGLSNLKALRSKEFSSIIYIIKNNEN